MTQDEERWPPLIVATHQPFWVRGRDFLLTAAMWLLLAAMLNAEFELFLGVYLERLGFDALLYRLGLADFDPKLDWLAFGRHLLPYLIVVLVLIASLTTFAAHTLLRRHRALREAKPRPLSLARQARDAALLPMAVRADVVSNERRAGLGETPVVDGRSLLAMLNGQDKETLAEARALRIAMVDVTADGRYRIERAPEPLLEGGAGS
jgi:hypothetical protein